LTRRWGCVSILVLSAVVAQSQSPQEQAVWKQEHAYREDVKNFDLERYRALWHSDFVGWPQSAAAPVRKANIADWFLEHKAKGEELAGFKLEPAASQIFGDNLVVTIIGSQRRGSQKAKHRSRADPGSLTQGCAPMMCGRSSEGCPHRRRTQRHPSEASASPSASVRSI
jgi:hypothetical protein